LKRQTDKELRKRKLNRKRGGWGSTGRKKKISRWAMPWGDVGGKKGRRIFFDHKKKFTNKRKGDTGVRKEGRT